MNVIFICVFHQDKYVDMFYLLLESILLYGNLEDTTILVYTSTLFMNRIKQYHLFNDKIKFEINDGYDTIEKACKARLDLFDLYIEPYDKILYLDTDIIIKDNIHKVFDICKDDYLYVLEEGTIDSHGDCWGKTLFGDEVALYDDKIAFTSGILLFKNSDSMKDLFQNINKDMSDRPFLFSCHDQPYIVYNAFKYNLYKKQLSSVAVNNDMDIYSDKVIHHFPGGPGVYQHKIDAMKIFLTNMGLFDTRNEMLRYYCSKFTSPKLLEIGVFKGDFLDYLVEHCTIGSIDAVDLFEGVTCSGDANGNNVIHYDTSKSYLELTEKYKNSKVTIIQSDSKTFLQKQETNTYDIIYIDGDHSYEGVKYDLIHAYEKIKNNGYIIGHDYEMNMNKTMNQYDFGVKKAVDEFCITYNQRILSKAMDGCVSYCIHIHKK